MARRRQEEPGIPTVRDALDIRNVDDLKKLLSLLPTAERPTRKGELVDLIERHLTGESLRALWEKLDDLQRKAVAETIHSDSPVFNAERFKAKYGAMPVFGEKKDRWSYGETPGLLRLFFYSDTRYSSSASAVLPDDLKATVIGIRAQTGAATAARRGRSAGIRRTGRTRLRVRRRGAGRHDHFGQPRLPDATAEER